MNALYDPDRHHRRSIRLRGFDYGQDGAYFITICVQDRVSVFGEILDREMRVNDAGRMVQTAWNDIPQRYAGVAIDSFVVMPNHVHGIVVFEARVGATPRGCPPPPTTSQTSLSLPDIVHRFKTLTTTRYTAGVKQYAWPAYRGRLWQRNYHERIIRNDAELSRLRGYIADNPARWSEDRMHPANVMT